MIVHVFNSTLVSGPETLVLPALSQIKGRVAVIFLSETRKLNEAQKPIQYARSLGLSTVSVPVGGRYDRQAISNLREVLIQLKPEITHAHDVKASTYLLRSAESIQDRTFQLISTHHGVHARSGLKNKLYEMVYTRFILPHYDQVFCVCSSDRKVLIQRGLNPDRVHTHLNGVNRRWVDRSERLEVRNQIHTDWNLRSLGISSQAILFGVVGRLAPEKRHDRLLNALAELKRLDSSLDWHLLCYGAGPLEASLKRLTQKLDLGGHVHWMGYRKEIGNEMAGFDLLFSLSDAEGLPINLLEAGWAGTPVVATHVDGNRDLFARSKTGILIHRHQSAEAIAREIQRLVSHSKERTELGFRFQKHVMSQFSEAVWLERLKELYRAGVTST